MSKVDLSKLSEKELLRTHDAILNELADRQVIRSKNNPTGDYAEWLASTILTLDLAPKSAKGYDATDSKGLRFQIKGRHLSESNKSVQMGVLRDLAKAEFHFLIAIVFKPNWDVQMVARIPHEAIESIATYRKHVNGHVMHMNNGVLAKASVEDITHLFR